MLSIIVVKEVAIMNNKKKKDGTSTSPFFYAIANTPAICNNMQPFPLYAPFTSCGKTKRQRDVNCE